LAGAAAGRTDDEQSRADEQAVSHAGLATDGPALVDFFRKRTPGEDARQTIDTLVRKLGHRSYRVREKACRELVVLGPPAASRLQKAARSKDPEVVRRAKRCLTEIDKSIQPELTAAAARLLAQRKPPQAIAALLDYLPFAPKDDVADEIISALAAIGVRGGTPDKAILAALKDKTPLKRAAAGEVLARAGGAKGRSQARPLLEDPDPQVRLRVALALIDQKDKEAVGVLVGLLPKLSRDQLWRVEPVLFTLAGDKAPAAESGSSDEDRRKYAAAWTGWWKEHGRGLDLAKIDTTRRMLGLTLIVQLDNRRKVGGGRRVTFPGRVFEVGTDGKPRWEITDLDYPIDAQVVGPNRVLVTEYRGRTVSERTFKGEMIWSKQVPNYPAGACRLANGHTLINARNQLIEVDRKGNDVSTRNTGTFLIGVGRTRNGNTVMFDHGGNCIHLDSAGKEVKRFQVVGGAYSTIGTHVDVLANGNVVIPQYNTNKVLEYDANGRKVWEVSVAQPTSVRRLRNGNTLVSSRYTRTVKELDRSGKTVWQYQLTNPGNLFHADRR
jgi:HEAT repeat protein